MNNKKYLFSVSNPQKCIENLCKTPISFQIRFDVISNTNDNKGGLYKY